jgi:peptide/nickel transport system substrate-binding protein
VDLAPLIRARLATVALLMGATGCAPEGACGEWCGTIVVVSGAEADVLLPPAVQSDVATSLNDLVFEKLADVGPEMNALGDDGFVPRLASAWRFPDPRTIEFTLAAGAQWHDGTPVTASDVAFTFAVYTDAAVAAVAAPRLGRIEAVTANNDQTVTFRFTEPYPEQFFDAVYHMWILPRHLLADVPRLELGSHAFGRNPVGSGPFRFVQWEAAQFVELAAVEDYHGGRPGVPRILWRFTADGPAAIAEILAGNADVLNVLPRPEDAERVAASDHARLTTYAVPVYAYLGFNLADPTNLDRAHPLFGDRSLRRALTQATDRAAIVRAVLGEGGEVPPGPVTPILGLWNVVQPSLAYDTAAAAETLDGLGWRDSDGDGVRDRDGAPLTIDLLVPSSSSARMRAAQIVQDQWRRVGVDLGITSLEFNAVLARAEAGRFDLFFGALAQDPSAASLTDTWSGRAIGGLNYGRYANPDVDALMDDATSVADGARAVELWQQALTLLTDDAPAVWIYVPRAQAAVHRRLQGVSIRPDQWSASLWQWTVDPRQALDRDVLGRD